MSERINHDCDAEVRRVNWRTGCPTHGYVWTCSCGRKWQWVEDEAEGGFFAPVDQPARRKGVKSAEEFATEIIEVVAEHGYSAKLVALIESDRLDAFDAAIAAAKETK